MNLIGKGEPYQSMSEAEIGTLVENLILGRVFMSDQLPEGYRIEDNFPLLHLLNAEWRDWLHEQNIVHVYGTATEGIRRVNRYPCCFRCHFLDIDDYRRVREAEARVRAAMKASLSTGEAVGHWRNPSTTPD